MPPLVSLGLHAGLLGAVLYFGARDRREFESRDRALAEVGIDADAPRAAALDDPAPPVEAAGVDPEVAPETDPRPEPQPVDLTGLSTTLASAAPSAILTGTGAPTTSSILAAAPGRADRPVAAASFAGLRSQAATRVVYVVDGSGAVVSSFSFIQSKLTQSIDRLGSGQRFNVVFFKDRTDRAEGDPPYEMLTPEAPIPAVPANQASAASWIDTVRPAGRSDPLDGLRPALAMQPDLVFLLSSSIPRTNAEWGAGREVILAELDRLNPVDPRTGKRPVVIKTIQFLRDDPSGLMRDIAQIHGDGQGSYRMLRFEDLRNEPEDISDVAIDPSDPSEELVVAAAAARLSTAERDGSVLAVLYGVPLTEQRSAAEGAAREALDLLGHLKESESQDVRVAMLRARAAVILASLSERPETRTALARTALTNAQGHALSEPAAESARRITRALALSMLGEHEAALDEARAIVRQSAGAQATPAELAEPVLTWARVAADPAQRAEAAEALARLARTPALAGDGLWTVTLAAGQSRALLAAETIDPRALDPLLALMGREDLIADETDRASLVYRSIAAATEPYAAGLDWSGFPPQAAFARAIVVGRSATGREEALRLLAGVAAHPAAGGLAPEALWEAAVLRRLDNTPAAQSDASAMLADLARRFPESPRAADALAASINEARLTDGELPESFELDLIRAAIDRFPDRPEIDIWRIDYAKRTVGMDRLAALEPVAPGTRQATLAAELYLPTAVALIERAGGAQRLQLMARAAAFARRHQRPEWASLTADLADASLSADPGATVKLAQTLLASAQALSSVPGGEPRVSLALAQGRRSLGDDAGAFEVSRSLAQRLEAQTPRPREFWGAWALMLEVLAGRDEEARAQARAHLARLRLLDPALGGPPFEARLGRLGETLHSAP